MFIRPLTSAVRVCLAVLCLGLFTLSDASIGFDNKTTKKTETDGKQIVESASELEPPGFIQNFSFCTNAYVSGEKGLIASSQGSAVRSLASLNGSTSDTDSWNRPEDCNNLLGSIYSNYQDHPFTVNASGQYRFENTKDGWEGSIILYENEFDPKNPLINCLEFSFDSPIETNKSTIDAVYLEKCSTYVLVVTGKSNLDNGSYSTVVTGPGQVIEPETGGCVAYSSGLYGQIQWYDEPEGDSPITTGNTFNPVQTGHIDPMIPAEHTFWVSNVYNGEESERIEATVYVGDCDIVISDPCSCRNNSSTLYDGQFNETVEVEGPSGAVWQVVSNIGLYEPLLPNSNQSTNLISLGTILSETPIGGGRSQYTLQGVHTDAQGYSIEVTNGITILSQSNTCYYPNPMITDLAGLLCTQTDAFTLTASIDQSGSGTFFIDGVMSDLFDPGALGPGDVMVEYNFVADGMPGPGVSEPGCAQSVSQEVTITADPNTACLRNINVGLGLDCSIEITIDMIQAADPCMSPGIYDLTVMDLDSNLIPGNTITEVGTFIGEVSNTTTGNSCWGYIHTEDKIAPDIECPNDVTIDCQDDIHPDNTGYPDATDNCDSLRYEYHDDAMLDNCNTGIIIRRWIVFDAFGNSDSCDQIINLIDNSILRVNWPDDITLSCPVELDELHPDQLSRRYARPLYNSRCRDLADNYRDEVYYECGPASFKILRHWVIRDWCDTDTTWRHVQTLKVIDTVPPDIVCPDDITLDVQHNECDVLISNFDPIVSDDCDPNPTFEREIYDEQDILVSGDRLSPGHYRVIFKASDACGNYDTCSSRVYIRDLIEPVAICDQNTNITLSNDGWADLCYTSIDDLSYDNCRVESKLIKREGEGDDRYRECITFRCRDVGENKVFLRVTDIYGNSNVCWANVYVEDKAEPKITCPSDVTVHCDVNVNDPDLTGGYPDVLDNCADLTPTFSDERDQYNCPTGVITRTWTVEKVFAGPDGIEGTQDDYVRTAQCEQFITVLDTTEVDIHWPNDLVVPCTGGAVSFAPGDLHVYNRQDTIFDYPVIQGEDCEHLGITFDDQVFQLCGPESYKIRRVWHIIDWCSDLDTTYIQTLWLRDIEPPTLNVDDVVVDITTNDPNCQAYVNLIAHVDDACTQAFVQNNSSFADLPNGDASGIYPKGTTNVTFIATDACGNRTEKTIQVIVQDRKKPTAICGAGFSASLKATGEVTVCADMFDRGSNDDCTFTENLILTIQRLDDQRNPVGSDQSCITYTCQDYEQSDLQFLRLVVTDAEGNAGFCETFIQLQDNLPACNSGNGNNTPTAFIQGEVNDDVGVSIENLNVYLDQNMMEVATDGYFMLDSIPTGKTYYLEMFKETPVDHGVSTLDMVLIRQHILRISELDGPYRKLAADVNGDGRVSTIDLVELRKAILKISDEFSGGYNWKFIPGDYQFQNQDSPWYEPYPLGKLVDLENNMSHVDFTGLKMGDVNGSAAARRSAQPLDQKNIILSDANDQDGYISREIHIDEINTFSGGQFALMIPQIDNHVPEIQSDILKESNWHITALDGKLIIQVSWLRSELISNGSTTLLKIKINSENADILEAIQLAANDLKPEIYDNTFRIHELQLVKRNDFNVGYALHQNRPNPFSNSTSIAFSIPKDDQVLLEVYDLSGHLLWQENGFFEQGKHNIEIDQERIGQSGIYIYQLTSGSFQQSKRMMLIE
jgi:hypothetical protein